MNIITTSKDSKLELTALEVRLIRDIRSLTMEIRELYMDTIHESAQMLRQQTTLRLVASSA